MSLKRGDVVPAFEQNGDITSQNQDIVDAQDKAYSEPIQNLILQLPSLNTDKIRLSTDVADTDLHARLLLSNKNRVDEYKNDIYGYDLRYWESNKFQTGFCPRIGVYHLLPGDNPPFCDGLEVAGLYYDGTNLFNPITGIDSGKINEGSGDLYNQDLPNGTNITLKRLSASEIQMKVTSSSSPALNAEYNSTLTIVNSGGQFCALHELTRFSNLIATPHGIVGFIYLVW